MSAIAIRDPMAPKRQIRAPSKTPMRRSIGDKMVFIAIGLVALAFGFGLHLEANLGRGLSFVAAITAFLIMTSAHFVIVHARRFTDFTPRLGRLENALDYVITEVDRMADMAEVTELSGNYDALSLEIAELRRKVESNKFASELAARDQLIMRLGGEIKKINVRITNMQDKFEQKSLNDKKQLTSELQALEGLVQQLTDYFAQERTKTQISAAQQAQIQQQTPQQTQQQAPQQMRQAPPMPSANIAHAVQPISSSAAQAGISQPTPQQPQEPQRVRARRSNIQSPIAQTKATQAQPQSASPMPPQVPPQMPPQSPSPRASAEHPAARQMPPQEHVPPASQIASPAQPEQRDTYSTEPEITDPQHNQDGIGLDPMLQIISSAIEENRVDLYLQPIVSLQDRKIKHYEAFTRIRDKQDALILPEAYIDLASQAGLMPLIDNIMLFRAIQVVQRLAASETPRGMFCNISLATLADPDFYPEFLGFLKNNQDLAKYLTFEFSQETLRQCGVIELDHLEQMSKLGFGFSLDNITDLNIDFRALFDQGFRAVKLSSYTLLHGMVEVGAQIHAADMASYLKRYGLQLIVDKIESEDVTRSLEPYGIRFGQGYIFSEPRPVRPEIFSDKGASAAA